MNLAIIFFFLSLKVPEVFSGIYNIYKTKFQSEYNIIWRIDSLGEIVNAFFSAPINVQGKLRAPITPEAYQILAEVKLDKKHSLLCLKMGNWFFEAM